MADAFQTIKLDNGDTLRFPAGMSDDDIQAAISKEYGKAPAGSGDLSVNNVVRSMATGMPIVGGLANKADAAINATVAPIGNRFFSPENQLQGDTWQQRYQNSLQQQNAMDAAYSQAHPVANIAGNIAGGVAATIPAVAAAPAAFGAVRGVGLPANMAMGATGGAAIGGTDAAIRGQSPTTGAALGATFGAAAPAIGRALGGAVGWLRDTLWPASADTALKGLDPRAVNWAIKAARADGLTEEQIAAKAQQLGPNGFLAEYGPNMRGLAGATAAMPGEGKTQIFSAMADRAAGTHGRIEDAFNAALGPRANTVTTADNIIAQRSAAAAPLYQAAYGAGDRPIWTPELERLSGAPEIQQAMSQAVAGWQRSAIASGYGAMQARPAVVNGVLTVPNGRVPAFPNLQFWDYTKGALDDMVAGEMLPDMSMTRKGRDLTILAQKLRGELDTQVPQYAQARAAWEGPSKVYEALQAGQTALRRSVSPNELAAEVGGMNQSQRDAYLVGLRGSLANLTDASVNGDTVARNLISSRGGLDKLNALIGPDRTAQLAGAMERERVYADTQNRTLQNSETAARQAMGEMLKPNPEDTLISRIRHAYSPHVTPGGLIPKGFQTAAEARQAAGYEASRNALAPMLTQQGASAANLARALVETGNRQAVQPAATTYANLLLQGAIAPLRQQTTQALSGQ